MIYSGHWPKANRPFLLALTALCVLAAKIIIAYNTYGTNDALTFEADIRKLETAGPRELYRTGVEPVPGHRQPFSHSPPVIHGLLLLHELEEQSGLPVRFWLRVSCAFSDLASLLLLWNLGVRSQTALFITAWAPVSVMVSGFHVNTDPIVVVAVLAAVFLIRSNRFAWAGLALGAGLSVKLTAMMFLPALLIAAGIKKSAMITGVAAGCFCLLSLPYIAEFPGVIGNSVLSYTGLSKLWGISGITLVSGGDGIYFWYQRFGKFVALGMIAVFAAITRSRNRQQDLLNNCGLSAALFLVLAPGFGVQYLVCLVPWLSVIRARTGLVFHVVSGVFLAAFYTWGSGGFPWYLANFFTSRPIPPHVFLLGLLTWIAAGIAAAGFMSANLVTSDTACASEDRSLAAPATPCGC